MEEVQMAESSPAPPLCIGKLILIPSVVTLGVTVLRLIGELQGWSPILFGTAAGGGGAIVGISWLPLIFGPFFAVKLAGAERGPARLGQAIGRSVAGLALFFLGAYVGFSDKVSFPGRMALGFVLMIVAGVVAFSGWPVLGKTLTAYGYAARIPVLIIMYFAINGSWGTHYDALPPGYDGPTTLLGKYFFVGVIPQLLFWIIYTLIVGSLLGSIAAAVVHRRVAPVRAA